MTTDDIAKLRADAEAASRGDPTVSTVIRDYHLARAVPALCDRVDELETALAVTTNSRNSNHRARLAAERERDAYRSMLCDLVAARKLVSGLTCDACGEPKLDAEWRRVRNLLKNGPTLSVMDE